MSAHTKPEPQGGRRTSFPFVPPSEPHWIVMCMSRFHDAPTEYTPRQFFRHPTEESANTEAARLATLNPGRRFSVYASGPSHKVEKVAVVP